jgi:hypothetical protein
VVGVVVDALSSSTLQRPQDCARLTALGR